MNVRSPAEVAIPWQHLEVRNAATSDIPDNKKRQPRKLPLKSGNCIVNYTGPISLAFTFCDSTLVNTSCEEDTSLSYLTSIR